jgi:hypothetical protein
MASSTLKQLLVPTCALDGQLVIGNDERPALGRRKVAEHNNRHFFHAELIGCQQTRVRGLLALGIRRSTGQRSI